MSVVDPREQYDDLIVDEQRERVGPDAFEELVRSETVVSGWLVLAFVFDREDRFLLVEHPVADEPSAPSAVPALSESLGDAVVRGVREDARVDVIPVRPHAVCEHAVVNDDTDEAAEWTTVFYEATADGSPVATSADSPTDSAAGRDPADEPPTDAGWFDDLPAAVRDAGPTARVYERCVENRRA